MYGDRYSTSSFHPPTSSPAFHGTTGIIHERVKSCTLRGGVYYGVHGENVFCRHVGIVERSCLRISARFLTPLEILLEVGRTRQPHRCCCTLAS